MATLPLDGMNGLIVPAAFLLDLVLGDPRRLPHPVQGIGWMIQRTEAVLRRFARAQKTEKIAGVVLVGAVVAPVYILTASFLSFVSSRAPSLGFILSVIIAYTTLAARGLADAGRTVLAALEAGDLPRARTELSMIVGRDTVQLDEGEISRAVVETIAENASDGVIAPLFYLAIGGPALALAYKAVNTLDSMVGYKNERYLHFGWAAARLDDAANYIPARITGLLICLADAIIRRMTTKGRIRSAANEITSDVNSELRTPHSALSSSWRIMLRDGKKHPSPNSGYPEAAMAGALGIRLGGPSAYGGRMSRKPFLGEAKGPIVKKHIKQSIRYLYGAALLGVLAASVVSLRW